MSNENKKLKICVVGLGYVGLPLAVEFGKIEETIGFDVNGSRIRELLSGTDTTKEVSDKEMLEARLLSYTSDLENIRAANVYIVTVPTPIDNYKRPDLSPLEMASHSIGQVLSKGDYVIYESTVYPGATEEVCVPIIENTSGLVFNQDFSVGYSPERINPGDKEHRVTNILKNTPILYHHLSLLSRYMG
jgi:UDP-N-acetyl-D-galactosamine dehydrogenase